MCDGYKMKTDSKKLSFSMIVMMIFTAGIISIISIVVTHHHEIKHQNNIEELHQTKELFIACQHYDFFK